MDFLALAGQDRAQRAGLLDLMVVLQVWVMQHLIQILVYLVGVGQTALPCRMPLQQQGGTQFEAEEPVVPAVARVTLSTEPERMAGAQEIALALLVGHLEIQATTVILGLPIPDQAAAVAGRHLPVAAMAGMAEFQAEVVAVAELV